VSRCIMVLSTLRAGSSCVAGALHRLGVDMGEGHFQPADKNNQAGYHEDLRWQEVTKRITGGRYYHNAYQPEEISADDVVEYELLAWQTQARRIIWGVKSPRMALTAHWIWPYLEDCRIVVVHRPREQSIASLQRHSHLGYAEQYRLTADRAAAIIDRHLAAVGRRLTEFRGPVLHVSYSALTAHPAWQLSRLVAFVFAGIEHLAPDDDRFQDVVDWIDPALNHHEQHDKESRLT